MARRSEQELYLALYINKEKPIQWEWVSAKKLAGVVMKAEDPKTNYCLKLVRFKKKDIIADTVERYFSKEIQELLEEKGFMNVQQTK